MYFNTNVLRFENYDYKNIGDFQQNFFYLKKIPVFAGMFLKRKIVHSNIRTKEVVDRSYNQSTWKRILQTKSWENTNSISDFFDSNIENNIDYDVDSDCMLLLNNKLQRTSLSNKNKAHLQLITELIKKYTKNDDEIVEIGCGYGLNLFYLASQGFQNQMSGNDISEKGIAAAKEINKHFNCNIQFDVVDMTKNLSSIKLKNKTVISVHSFEQIKYDTTNVINDLINAGVSQVIHFEPISDLYGINIRDISSFLYIKARDYQDNLLKTLKSFEKVDKLKILDSYRLGFATNPFHETSLTRWVPTP